ncbi:hypothetical protein LINPERPRIM_LOCUS7022 [Linum perenne]
MNWRLLRKYWDGKVDMQERLCW